MDIFRHAEATPYPAGTVVFREGDPGDSLFVIKDGRVELRIGGRPVVTLGAGEIFGEMALIDEAPRSATAVAVADSRIAPVDRRRFEFLVQNTPFFSLDVMRVMAARLRGMDARFARSPDGET